MANNLFLASNKNMKLLLILIIALVVSACGGQTQKSEKEQSIPQPSVHPETKSTTTNSMENHPGKKVYDSLCLICHMPDGAGVPGMYPPLIQTDWVVGDKDRLIDITINGLSGEITVDGEVYNSIMPPNLHLSDQQVADVLTYIRKSFGNDASEITAEEVEEVRNQ